MSLVRWCRRSFRVQSCVAVLLYALLIVTCANWFTATLTSMTTDAGSPKVPPKLDLSAVTVDLPVPPSWPPNVVQSADRIQAPASPLDERVERNIKPVLNTAAPPAIPPSFRRRSLTNIDDNVTRPPPAFQKHPESYLAQLRNETSDQGQIQPNPPMAPPKPSGPFIAPERIVHFDLKGAPPKAEYLIYLFGLVKSAGATGVLLEWEDTFPYTGKLANATSLVAYTGPQVHAILQAAQKLELSVIPLVQTFAHLEWILKLAQFQHLRDNPTYSTVMCVAKEEAWELLKDMVEQVAVIHAQYGMAYYHIGCDEVFQMGICGEASAEMRKQGGKDKYMTWHIARMAAHIRDKHEGTKVQIWHDMIAHLPAAQTTALHGVVEPVVWNYAEDIERYMSSSVWDMLRPFGAVWGASAFKGADGPMRYHANPNHYVRNHQSWLRQIAQQHRKFSPFRGIILTGWSRYDHFAVLAEILPVAVPSLLMSLITLTSGSGSPPFASATKQLVGCALTPTGSTGQACNFTGFTIYQQVQQLRQLREEIQRDIYSDKDPGFEYNGWLGRMNLAQSFSSNWYLQKLIPKVNGYFSRLTNIFKTLQREMLLIYEEDTVAEFLYEYVGGELERLGAVKTKADKIRLKGTFDRRPLPGVHDQLAYLNSIVG